MTRAHALTMLLRLGPLTYVELREITGWPDGVLNGALYHACRALGTVGRTWRRGWRVFHAKNEQELQRRPPRKRRRDAGQPRRRHAAQSGFRAC